MKCTTDLIEPVARRWRAHVKEVIEGLPFADYCEIVAMNSSTIVEGINDDHELSMHHLRHAWLNPLKDTPARKWGRMMHTLLFEPHEFEEKYAIWNDGPKVGLGYKNWKHENRGCEIIGWKEQVDCVHAAAAFLQNNKIQEIIKDCVPELTLLTPTDGIQCKCKIDCTTTDRRLVDFKTTRRKSAAGFGRDFFGYKYDIKLGLYRYWLRQHYEGDWPCEVITMENEPPFYTRVIPIPHAVLDRGEEIGLKVIRALREAIDSDSWPGWDNGEYTDLVVPIWSMPDDEVDYEGVQEIKHGD
jgi:hypothetical protein